MKHSCPKCGLIQQPILVVRGLASTARAWTLRCHSCEFEWLQQQPGASSNSDIAS